MLEHGGRLREAARRYGLPPNAWLDLSTGINPHAWPVPAVPGHCWQRLPEEDDGLEAAARDCYGAPQVLPVAGSQAAIQALPRLRPPGRVGILHPGYAEHAHAWEAAGHQVARLPAECLEQELNALDVLVLIHPNNPTGACFPTPTLLDWHARLAARGGWLLVDEAFMDPTPEHSLAPFSDRPGLIVLRSLGKFFGLAGARAGFVCAGALLLARLAELLGPWTLTGPSRYVAAAALRDLGWQAAMRQRLPGEAARLRALLAEHGLPPAGGCALFQWSPTPRASALQDALAREGVWVRRFATPSALRFGLPRSETDWGRLADALALATEAGVTP
ncbi:MAG TPA: threonine-phosphate decarboxylase [Thiotrichales bacterium]|nr:threonine-phosphate decarboxylase [Thiotrichales bacterium]